MAGYAKPNIGKIVLTFIRDGMETDHRVCPNGMTAISTAMKILSFKDELRPGDTLTVSANDGDPAASGPNPGGATA